MCKCRRCENLNDGVPVFVKDMEFSNPFMEDLGHWEDGFLCYQTGKEARTVEELFRISNCNKK